jgi:AraC-like DNA-binding protein
MVGWERVRPDTLAARRRLYLLARVVVARHYSRRLTLAIVARALSSSPRQVQRAYAAFGELSFHEDLLARRMSAAAQLLADQPAIAVRDVARLVGYRQAPHFARAFRRRYGLAPATFREQAREHRAQTGERSAPDTPAAACIGACSRPSEEAGAIDSAAGSRSRMSVPPPSAGSAVTRPPCWSTTWRTIASPRPEPGRPRASAPR